MAALKSIKRQKTSTKNTRCFYCREHEIKYEKSLENPKICKNCYKKNLPNCIHVKPSYYSEEIKRLNSVVNNHVSRILLLEKQ
ncbi:27340_t:CDS:1, partial [Dentiscutata erythropus]